MDVGATTVQPFTSFAALYFFRIVNIDAKTRLAPLSSIGHDI